MPIRGGLSRSEKNSQVHIFVDQAWAYAYMCRLCFRMKFVSAGYDSKLPHARLHILPRINPMEPE